MAVKLTKPQRKWILRMLHDRKDTPYRTGAALARMEPPLAFRYSAGAYWCLTGAGERVAKQIAAGEI
jgi:hypothetical protein